MNRYTLYCTEEQTKKAFELGAPIKYKDTLDNRERGKFETPTAEQMIGWLEEQGFNFEEARNYTALEHDDIGTIGIYERSRKEATLAAIDAALEYLSSSSYHLDKLIKSADNVLKKLSNNKK